MKVSLVATFRDEEAGIEGFIESIFSQSRPPDEVVLVDGGSTDRTVELVEKQIERYGGRGTAVRLIVERGCNISRGRNRAIREASFDVIAVSDAGCTLAPDWLAEMVAPMEEDEAVDVVAGNYRVEAEGLWERVTSSYLMPFPERAVRSMPSGRSTAFRRKAWEAVGGYPEWLDHAEDTFFAAELRRKGHRIHFSPKAVVLWRPRSGPVSFFRQYFRYAVGDGRAGLSRRHYGVRIGLYGVGALLATTGSFAPLGLLAGLYLALITGRYLLRGRDRALFFLVPPVVLLHDVAQVTGYLAGRLAGGKGRR